MTSPMAYMLPLPQHGGRYQRDDDYFSSSKQQAGGSRHARDLSMERTSSLDPRLRDGASPAPPPVQVSQRQLVCPDPLAFRFLEQDSSVTVIKRQRFLRGYELYLVEQWACSRQSPTVVVTTYTGDERHCIVVGILSIPEDESLWSSRLRIYFQAASQCNARPKETDLGELMVTNLSSFPSSLTVIPVPDGDVRSHRQLFIVNEDLKRLGCSGRSGLALTKPTEATQSKFHQLYKTSERIPILQSVIELVKLCQVALYMFEKLDQQYVDGLLCDFTETAISNWWAEVGAEHYNFEPSDGILGPSTVAALLGMLMGARNRLHWYGAPVSKDVFDIESTKRGVAYFQKQQKLDKSRRLDRQTLFRLHTATAKGAAGEGWGVQKAVKSTVTEIGGKRGEIVMDMVSGKDKGGLADIETLDIDSFVSLTYGDRPKWLWHGKTRRYGTDTFGEQEMGGMLLEDMESADTTAKRTQSLPLSVDDLSSGRRDDNYTAPYTALSPSNHMADVGDRDPLRRGVFKSVAGKMNDARSGFGRIKDAVGGNRRGHTSRLSISTKEDTLENQNGDIYLPSASQNSAMASSPAVVGRAFTWKNKPDEYLAAIRRGDPDVLPGYGEATRHVRETTKSSRTDDKSGDELTAAAESERSLGRIGSDIRKDLGVQGSSDVQSVDDEDLEGPLLEAERKPDAKLAAISRRHSCGVADVGCKLVTNESRWPRRLSFGDAEEAILTWEEVIDITETSDYLTCIEAHAEAASHLDRLIDGIVQDVGPWVQDKLKNVEMLNERYGRDKTELQTMYHQLNEAYQRVRYNSDDLLSEQRQNLTESVNEIELLVARLEYEMNSLVAKVQDVEDGIQHFERQVENVESKSDELKAQLETESWLHWFVRTLTGIGTGPNITRES